MKKHFIFVFLCSIGFTDVIKPMEYNNCTGSLFQALANTTEAQVISHLVLEVGLVFHLIASIHFYSNYFEFSEKKKTHRPFPKKALIKHLKQQNSTQFNSRKNGFYRFGKR